LDESFPTSTEKDAAKTQPLTT